MVINFGAGPAKLPEPVLLRVQRELLNCNDTGMSVMEMSHRGADYKKIHEHTQQMARQLLKIPDNYEILFFQGGGTGLFAAVCMNLMGRNASADYVVTGSWSAKAAKEAEKYGKVNRVFPKPDKFTTIADQKTWNLNSDAAYLYYCENETVDGVEFQFIPETKNNVPLVCDMSSNFFSRKVDVSKFGLIYGGAQKNIGPAGVALMIIRKDLIGNALPITPSIWDFSVMLKENSIQNTPPTFAIYVIGCVFDWISAEGGVEEMDKRSMIKSKMIYEEIANSNGFYVSPVEGHCRSRMNIPFRIGSPAGDDDLEKEFLKQAQSLEMAQLKGHRSVGGIRASLYNAISIEETTKLANFMKEFRQKNQK